MLIGRGAELARVEELVSGLGADSGFALLISADAGMGKSALLDAVADRATGPVLRARGVLSEARIAFAGLQELLTPVLDRAAVLPERPRSALYRCLALESGSTDEMAALVAATMLLTAAAADGGPLLCLIDDAHWLDESSVDALLFAARRHPRGVGFIFAARPDSPRFDESWLPRIVLGGLDDADARALLAQREPRLTRLEVDQVLRASDGCPLALLEFGRAVAHGNRTVGSAPLPLSAGLEAAFAATVRALPKPTQRALLALAASDTEEASLVSRAVEVFGGRAADLDPAIDSGLLVNAGSHLRFRHPLVRAAVYQSAGRERQRAAHQVLAGLFAEEPERAAWHRAAATDAPDDGVAAALVQSARLARRRGGYPAEALALERAARLTPDPTLSTARLAAAAAAALQAGKHLHAEKLLREVVARTDDPVVLADAEHERAQIVFWRDGRRSPTVVEAAGRVAAVDRQRAARLLSFDLIGLISDYQASAALPIALRAWELVGKQVEPFEVAFRVAHVLIMAGRTEAGADLTARVAAAAEADGHSTAAVNIAQPCIWLERYDQARSLLSSSIAALRSVDALWMLGHALVAQAELERRLGRLTTARLAAGEALALAEQLAEPMQEAEALVQLAAVEADLGQPVECLAHAQRAARLAESRECGKGELLALGAAALGGLALAAGRPAEAAAHLEPQVTGILQAGVADPAVVPGVVDLIEAYAQCGRPGDARHLHEWLATHAERCGRGWAKRAVLRCEVLHNDSPHARSALAAALADCVPATRLQTGRDWLALGAAERRAGQRSSADKALRRAHTIFAEIGARAWTERAAAELRALGARVPSTRRDPLNTLTPQEARVAQLVATGARNREVAAALFVTPKTVETHLAAVYRKLGIRTRTELAGRLAQPGSGNESQGFA